MLHELVIVSCAANMNETGDRRAGVRIFTHSAARHMPNARVAILSNTPLDGLHPGTLVVNRGFAVGDPILTRWKVFHEFLVTQPDDQMVLMSDCRDVVFNGNVIPYIHGKLGGADGKPPLKVPLFFSEHQTTGGHAWCISQAMKLEGLTGVSHDRNLPEINGGVIAGRAAVLAKFTRDMMLLCGLVAKTKISDQPIINKWARENACVLCEDRSVYCHGELVKAGRWDMDKFPPVSALIFHQYERSRVFAKKYKAEYPAHPSSDDSLPETSEGDKVVAAQCAGKQIVVSHYAEKLRRIREWIPEMDLLVYAKGPGEPPADAVQLPNVGYEAHTWFHHFATRYNELPPVTICVQGDPFDHWKEQADELRRIVLAINPETFTFRPLTGLGNGKWQTRDGKPDHHPQLNGVLDRMWRAILGYPPPDLWFSWYSGQFAVSRDTVHRRPREFYEHAAEVTRSKLEACAVERMWGAIFG